MAGRQLACQQLCQWIVTVFSLLSFIATKVGVHVFTPVLPFKQVNEWFNFSVYIHFITVRNFNSLTSFPGGVTCQAQSTHAELLIGLVHGPHPSSLLASDKI